MTKLLTTKPKLTIKQQRFINEYIKSGNGADAVRRAGYTLTSKNGSKTHIQALETASSISTENLRNPAISNAISKELLKLKLTPENILNRIDRIADDSEAKHSDRLKALELLGKHTSLFNELTENKPTTIVLNLGVQVNNKGDRKVIQIEPEEVE